MSFWERLGSFCVRRSRAVLVAVALVSGFLGAGLLRLDVDTSFLSFMRPESRALVRTIEDDFAEGCYLTLVFESRGGRSLLEPALLQQQLRILQDLRRNQPVTTFSLVEGIDQGLRRVKHVSLLDVSDYSTIAEAILGLAGGRTVRDLAKVSAHFLSNPEAIDFYARLRIAQGVTNLQAPGAPDTRYALPFVKAIKALVRTDPGESRQVRRRTLAEVRRRLESLATPEVAVYALNDDLVSYDIDRSTQERVVPLGAMVFGVDLLCVALLFRSRREAVLVFAILATACLWTFGLAGWLGIPLSFLHLLAVPILLGTGVDDTFVFGRRLAEERRAGRPFGEAVRATFAGSGDAIFLTSFTTFLAFGVTGLTARADVFASFFLLVSASMAIVLALTLLLEGALRAELERWWPARAPEAVRPSLLEAWNRRLTALSRRASERSPRGLLVTAVVVVALSLGSASRLGSGMGRGDLLQPGMDSFRANEVMQHYFGESRVGYVLFSGAVESPALLVGMRQLERRLAGRPEIEQVLRRANVDSVTDLLDKEGVRITDRTDVRAVLDRLRADDRTADYAVDMSFRDAADYVVRRRGDRYDGLLMRFFVPGETSEHTLAATALLRREITALGLDRLPGVDVAIGGGDVVYPLESVYYADTMTRSFFLSLAANWLVLVVAWRRFAPACIAVAPIVVAVAVVVGSMPVFGVALNPLNLGIGAIIVGLGIDYPIHLVERHHEERRRGASPREAAARALETMGPHMLAGMATTAVGFCASCVLLLPMSTSFGLLTGTAVVLDYGASLFLLPALLVAADRGGQPVGRPGAAEGR